MTEHAAFPTGATPKLASIEEIGERLASIRQRIDAVAAGRPVTVVAVTKTWPVEITRRAMAVGLVDCGENYAQALAAKANELAEVGDGQPRWHFIGGLQRNKIKLLAGVVDLWQTVDRDVLIDQISARAPGSAILIQVNTTNEEQKSGCKPDDVGRLIEHGLAAGLEVRGLMTLGPTGGADPRPSFAGLAALADRYQLPELSMGMTGDFELAVAEGSTIVRIGSALFGARQPKVG